MYFVSSQELSMLTITSDVPTNKIGTLYFV